MNLTARPDSTSAPSDFPSASTQSETQLPPLEQGPSAADHSITQYAQDGHDPNTASARPSKQLFHHYQQQHVSHYEPVLQERNGTTAMQPLSTPAHTTATAAAPPYHEQPHQQVGFAPSTMTTSTMHFSHQPPPHFALAGPHVARLPHHTQMLSQHMIAVQQAQQNQQMQQQQHHQQQHVSYPYLPQRAQHEPSFLATSLSYPTGHAESSLNAAGAFAHDGSLSHRGSFSVAGSSSGNNSMMLDSHPHVHPQSQGDFDGGLVSAFPPGDSYANMNGPGGAASGMGLAMACSFCRKRKIKCDGNRPICSSCVEHNQGRACEYVAVSEAENAALRNQKRARRARLAAIEILSEPNLQASLQKQEALIQSLGLGKTDSGSESAKRRRSVYADDYPADDVPDRSRRLSATEMVRSTAKHLPSIKTSPVLDMKPEENWSMRGVVASGQSANPSQPSTQANVSYRSSFSHGGPSATASSPSSLPLYQSLSPSHPLKREESQDTATYGAHGGSLLSRTGSGHQAQATGYTPPELSTLQLAPSASSHSSSYPALQSRDVSPIGAVFGADPVLGDEYNTQTVLATPQMRSTPAVHVKQERKVGASFAAREKAQQEAKQPAPRRPRLTAAARARSAASIPTTATVTPEVVPKKEEAANFVVVPSAGRRKNRGMTVDTARAQHARTHSGPVSASALKPYDVVANATSRPIPVQSPTTGGKRRNKLNRSPEVLSSSMPLPPSQQMHQQAQAIMMHDSSSNGHHGAPGMYDHGDMLHLPAHMRTDGAMLQHGLYATQSHPASLSNAGMHDPSVWQHQHQYQHQHPLATQVHGLDAHDGIPHGSMDYLHGGAPSNNAYVLEDLSLPIGQDADMLSANQTPYFSATLPSLSGGGDAMGAGHPPPHSNDGTDGSGSLCSAPVSPLVSGVPLQVQVPADKTSMELRRSQQPSPSDLKAGTGAINPHQVRHRAQAQKSALDLLRQHHEKQRAIRTHSSQLLLMQQHDAPVQQNNTARAMSGFIPEESIAHTFTPSPQLETSAGWSGPPVHPSDIAAVERYDSFHAHDQQTYGAYGGQRYQDHTSLLSLESHGMAGIVDESSMPLNYHHQHSHSQWHQ